MLAHCFQSDSALNFWLAGPLSPVKVFNQCSSLSTHYIFCTLFYRCISLFSQCSSLSTHYFILQMYQSMCQMTLTFRPWEVMASSLERKSCQTRRINHKVWPATHWSNHKVHVWPATQGSNHKVWPATQGSNYKVWPATQGSNHKVWLVYRVVSPIIHDLAPFPLGC